MHKRINKSKQGESILERVQPTVVQASYQGIYAFRAPQNRTYSPSKGFESCLIVMQSGIYRAEYTIQDQRTSLEAKAGDIVFWPEGQSRLESNDPSKPMQSLVISMACDHSAVNLPFKVHDRRGIIRNLSEILLQIRTWPSTLRSSVESGYLAGIMAEYERLAFLAQNDLEYKTICYIEEHIAEPISLSDLARHAGYHRHHFARKYKACTGRTPLGDVRRIRAEYARGMLSGTRKFTLRQIARHIGLANEFQVSRLIKQYIGTPVRELRK